MACGCGGKRASDDVEEYRALIDWDYLKTRDKLHIISSPYVKSTDSRKQAGGKGAAELARKNNLVDHNSHTFDPNVELAYLAQQRGWNTHDQEKHWEIIWEEVLHLVCLKEGKVYVMCHKPSHDRNLAPVAWGYPGILGRGQVWEIQKAEMFRRKTEWVFFDDKKPGWYEMKSHAEPIQTYQISRLCSNDGVQGDDRRHLHSGLLEAAVKKIEVSATVFEDQLWGNAKSCIILELQDHKRHLQKDINVFGTYRSEGYSYGPSPSRTLSLSEDIVRLARKGWTLELKYVVGGGGGHRIRIENLRMVVHYREVPSGNWLATSKDVKFGDHFFCDCKVTKLSGHILFCLSCNFTPSEIIAAGSLHHGTLKGGSNLNSEKGRDFWTRLLEKAGGLTSMKKSTRPEDRPWEDLPPKGRCYRVKFFFEKALKDDKFNPSLVKRTRSELKQNDASNACIKTGGDLLRILKAADERWGQLCLTDLETKSFTGSSNVNTTWETYIGKRG